MATTIEKSMIPDVESDSKKRNTEDVEDIENESKRPKTEDPQDGKLSTNGAKENPEKQTGTPLICGSLNWDLMGRKDKRVNTKPRKVEPAWEPQIVGALSGVRITDIIAGPSATHSFFISDDGKLFGLGRNEQGQLGLGNTKRQDGAKEVPFFKNMKVIGASGGKGHSIVLTEDNGAYGMGDNQMGQLGIGSNKGTLAQVITPKKVVLDEKIKEVACGLDYTLFVTAAGHLFSAGSSESGQLGVNDNGEYIDGRKLFYTAQTSPERIHSFFSKDSRTKEVVRVPNVVIRNVSAGSHHCLAVSTTDELFTWGFNGHGRLGHRTTENELVPLRVNFFSPGSRNGGVKMAKCSFEGCFAVNSLGNAYCWGQNQINKLESPYPIPLEDLYGWNINDLSPGRNHHIISADTSVIAMGKQTQGELGLGPSVKSSSRPDKMSSVEGLKVIQCAVGTNHTLLLALDDTEEAKKILEELDTNDD